MAWKKQEPTPTAPERQVPSPSPSPRPSAPDRPARTIVAAIGPSISIDGDLKGKEDLLIEGRVNGTVQVDQHLVTIGSSGKVQANVYGKAIRVEGEVHGDLFGSEEIVIHQSGKVEGNLTAPRVTLEDGSTFRGSIDMSAPKHSSNQTAAGSNQMAAGKSPAKAAG